MGCEEIVSRLGKGWHVMGMATLMAEAIRRAVWFRQVGNDERHQKLRDAQFTKFRELTPHKCGDKCELVTTLGRAKLQREQEMGTKQTPGSASTGPIMV